MAIIVAAVLVASLLHSVSAQYETKTVLLNNSMVTYTQDGLPVSFEDLVAFGSDNWNFSACGSYMAFYNANVTATLVYEGLLGSVNFIPWNANGSALVSMDGSSPTNLTMPLEGQDACNGYHPISSLNTTYGSHTVTVIFDETSGFVVLQSFSYSYLPSPTTLQWLAKHAGITSGSICGGGLVAGGLIFIYISARRRRLRKSTTEEIGEEDSQDGLLRPRAIQLHSIKAGPCWCAICHTHHGKGETMSLPGCSHRFCKDGLRQLVESGLDVPRFPIMCPVCVLGDKDGVVRGRVVGEGGVVTESLLKQLMISEAYQSKWNDLVLREHSVQVTCNQCQRSVLIDREDHKVARFINCPLADCFNRWCKRCSTSVDASTENDHPCDGSSALEATMHLEGWKRCPTCHTAVERSFGCNHMICTVPSCNTHFCYVDGLFICRSQNLRVIREAVDLHYRACCLHTKETAP